MARKAIERVSSPSVSQSSDRAAVSTPEGSVIATGKLTVPAFVAACRYVVRPPIALSRYVAAATQQTTKPARNV
jgi:hypothetical protein